MKIFKRTVLALILVILMSASAYAVDAYRPWVRTQDLTVMNIPTFERGLGLETSGDAWYVDSGASGTAAGTSWTNASLTLDAAINLATASNGDIIRVAAGHAESFTAANGFDLDKAGITVVFHGNGLNAAVFTFADTDATVAIGAASCSLLGPVRFLAGISEVVSGIIVEAAGTDFLIDGAIFPEPTTSTFEFDIAISVLTGAHRGTIQNVTAFSADATGASSWLSIETGVVHDWKLINNRVFGEYSAANVVSDQINLEMFINYGEYTNMTTGVHAIEFSGASTGSVNNVLLRTDTQGTTIDPGSMTINNVFWDDEDTADSIAIPVILATAGAASIGPSTSTTTDSVHGKLGSDAEFADSSVYDMLGAGAKTLAVATSLGTIDSAVTSDIHGKIGTDSEMGDVSLYDMWVLDQVDIDAILADTITISGGTLPAAPTSGSLATFVSGGSVGLGQPLPASTSLIDIIGNFTGPYGGAAQDDNVKASLDLLNTDSAIIVADTPYIADLAIVDPVADSLASFIVSGGTAAGQPLPTSTSIVDIIGDFTGPYNGAAQDDNIKASLDLLNTDTAAILGAQVGGGAGNYFAVTADLSSATWNTVAAHEIAVVTGAVRMQIMVECTASTTSVSNDGTMSLGWAGNTAAIFALTDYEGGAGALVTGNVLSYVYAGTFTGEVGGGRYFAETAASTVADVVIVGSVDVGYSLAVNAGATGTLVFHVWWQPMSAGATVTAGAGGPFT